MEPPTWSEGGLGSGLGGLAGPGLLGVKEDEMSTMRALFAKLDVPTWGKAAAELAKAASEAEVMAALSAQCDAGDDAIACSVLSAEEDAWLAKMEAPPWCKGARKGAQANATVAAQAAPAPALAAAAVEADDVGAASPAGLAKLGVPTWGKAATELSRAAAAAARIAAQTEKLSKAEATWLTFLEDHMGGTPPPDALPPSNHTSNRSALGR